jgi:2-phosphosulfolactate phosphatase
MNLDVTATWREAESASIEGTSAVVIDVLRASSTIVTALESGASRIIPVASVDEAREVAAKSDGSLLCGERGGKPLPGFDLGNSPLEYTPEAVAGRTLVITTTNGTSAVRVASCASEIVTCALLNIDAVASRLLSHRRDVVIVCSGTEGRVSKEDLFCAGYLASRVMSPGVLNEITDGARVALEWYNARAGQAEYVLRSCQHGRRLISMGFGEDVDYCGRANTSGIVPVLTSGAFTPGE